MIASLQVLLIDLLAQLCLIRIRINRTEFCIKNSNLSYLNVSPISSLAKPICSYSILQIKCKLCSKVPTHILSLSNMCGKSWVLSINISISAMAQLRFIFPWGVGEVWLPLCIPHLMPPPFSCLISDDWQSELSYSNGISEQSVQRAPWWIPLLPIWTQFGGNPKTLGLFL